MRFSKIKFRANLSTQKKTSIQTHWLIVYQSKLVRVVSPKALFQVLCYVNYIWSPYASKLTQPLLFDDDTSIFYSHSDPDYLESVLNDEVWNLDIWMKCNKLSVNFKKTSYIIFKLRQKKLGKSFSLSFGNQTLKQVNETVFLGVYIDEHLTRKPHISFVAKQILSQPV